MSARRLVVAFAALAALAVPEAPPAAAGGQSDFWHSAARDPEAEVAERDYDAKMLEGDNNLDFAVAEVQVASRRKRYVDAAISAYEGAARARPEKAEPHFRAAAALHAFYIECNTAEGAALCRATGANPIVQQRVMERIIRHWDQFEAKAPRDPRLVDDIFFERAILHTKIATPEHLALARDDYKKLLARGSAKHSRYGVLASGNLAETEMMLGDLDAAIIQYRRTLELSQSVSLYFGLAVALDRDEQGHLARSLLGTFGLSGVRTLEEQITRREVFYVPEGEAYYYLALGYESIGVDEVALRYYDLFLATGAHPQFAPRARANRAAIVGRRSKRTPVPTDEYSWKPR
jgi:tetratricopeptide (TPR) repeat protein